MCQTHVFHRLFRTRQLEDEVFLVSIEDFQFSCEIFRAAEVLGPGIGAVFISCLDEEGPVLVGKLRVVDMKTAESIE